MLGQRVQSAWLAWIGRLLAVYSSKALLTAHENDSCRPRIGFF